jgi:hypothetical protein
MFDGMIRPLLNTTITGAIWVRAASKILDWIRWLAILRHFLTV